MATTSTQAQKIPQPKLKTSLSNPLIYPESSQINQSPTSYHSQLPSPSNNHNKTKSRMHLLNFNGDCIKKIVLTDGNQKSKHYKINRSVTFFFLTFNLFCKY